VSTSIGTYFFSMEEANEQLQYVIDRIKDIRIQKSMSQLELAFKANMSQSFLASVEKGKKQPSVLTLLRIANALHVNPKNFFPENKNTSKEDIKDNIISLLRSL
jgi:transcriptional regulator with XRE-family HTH domain